MLPRTCSTADPAERMELRLNVWRLMRKTDVVALSGTIKTTDLTTPQEDSRERKWKTNPRDVSSPES